MFATVGIDEPIEKIFDDWDYLDEKVVKKFTTWQVAGQNIIGIRRRTITLNEIVDPKKGAFNSITMTPDGLLSKQHKAFKIHITPGGVPHRVEHSLGFWHINDMDELYLPLPSADGDPLGHFVVIMQTPTGREGESFVFYCQNCFTMLHEVYCPTGALGLPSIFRAEERAVREFNAEAAKRVCVECGHVNPFGYCWNTAKDTPEERDARAIW